MDQAPEVQEWATEHILEGVRQADAGEFATDEEVEAAFSRWRK
jgi:predicted transcriptional regulator